jgi:hypothetical protein
MRATLIAMAVLLCAGAVAVGVLIAMQPAQSTYYPTGPTHLIGVSPSPRCSTGQADIPGVNC